MTAPNLMSGNSAYGQTTATQLIGTALTTIVSNAIGSNSVYKINTLNIANNTTTAIQCTVNYNTGAAGGGTNLPLINAGIVPAYGTLTVIDRGTQYYLAEGSSITASLTATNNWAVISTSFEVIS